LVSALPGGDEIAAITAAIGASYGGSLGITTHPPWHGALRPSNGLAVMLVRYRCLKNHQYTARRPIYRPTYQDGAKRLLQPYYAAMADAPSPVIFSIHTSDVLKRYMSRAYSSRAHERLLFSSAMVYIANGSRAMAIPRALTSTITVTFRKS